MKTAKAVPDGLPTTHYTGYVDPATEASLAMCVVNFVVEMDDEPLPTVDGVELLEAKWVTIGEARSLRTGRLTRVGLRKLWPDF
jgi:hypothetical protein